LIKKYNSIHLGIEESPHLVHATTARAAVQEYGRLAVRVARLLIIEFVATADFQIAGMVRFDGRIQLPSFGLAVHGRHYERVSAGLPRIVC
jgi:hypothetical protein